MTVVVVGAVTRSWLGGVNLLSVSGLSNISLLLISDWLSSVSVLGLLDVSLLAIGDWLSVSLLAISLLSVGNLTVDGLSLHVLHLLLLGLSSGLASNTETGAAATESTRSEETLKSHSWPELLAE